MVGSPPPLVQLGADRPAPIGEPQPRMQSDADVAEVVMGAARTRLGHRHLGAELRSVLTQLFEVPGQSARHRGQHAHGHGRARQTTSLAQHRAEVPRAVGPCVATQHRPRLRLRRNESGSGVADQPPVCPRRRGGPLHPGPFRMSGDVAGRDRRVAAEQPGGQRRRALSVAQCVRHLQHRHRTGTGARAAKFRDRGKDVQTPWRHPRVELVVAEVGDRGQTRRPRRVSGPVHREAVGLDRTRLPPRVRPEPRVGDPYCQRGTFAGAAAERLQRRARIGQLAIERVDQELVVRDRRCHPVHLRVDRCQPTRCHDSRTRPTPGRTPRSASGRRPCPGSPARWTPCRSAAADPR